MIKSVDSNTAITYRRTCPNITRYINKHIFDKCQSPRLEISFNQFRVCFNEIGAEKTFVREGVGSFHESPSAPLQAYDHVLLSRQNMARLYINTWPYFVANPLHVAKLHPYT